MSAHDLISSDKVDELLHAISGLSSALQKFATDSAKEPTSANAKDVRKSAKQPYLQIQTFYTQDELENEHSVKTSKLSSRHRASRRRCPFAQFEEEDEDECESEWDRFKQQQQPSALAALVELVFIVGMLFWVLWVLGNVSY